MSGSYFVDSERHGEWRAPQSSMFADGGISRRRGRCLATRLAEDEATPLTAEALDAAIAENDAAHTLDGSLLDSFLEGNVTTTGKPRQQRRLPSARQQWAAAWADLAPVAATGAGASHGLQTCTAAAAAAGLAVRAAGPNLSPPPIFSLVAVHRLLLGSSRPPSSYRRQQRPWFGRRGL